MMDIEFPEIVGSLADLPEQTIKVVKAYAKATAAINVSALLTELKALRAYKEAAEKQEPYGYIYDGQILCDDGDFIDYFDGAEYDKSAMLKVYAKPAVAAPDGWKLVPIEPTEQMRNAANVIDENYPERKLFSSELFMDVYRAMLAAAPSHGQQSARITEQDAEKWKWLMGSQDRYCICCEETGYRLSKAEAELVIRNEIASDGRCPSHESEKQLPDEELPGMWSNADLSGRWADSCNEQTDGGAS